MEEIFKLFRRRCFIAASAISIKDNNLEVNITATECTGRSTRQAGSGREAGLGTKTHRVRPPGISRPRAVDLAPFSPTAAAQCVLRLEAASWTDDSFQPFVFFF